MRDPSCIALETLDGARVAAVAAALGDQRFGELLAILGQRLQVLARAIAALPEHVQNLPPSLHQSRGSAASLGLVVLAAALTNIEADLAAMLANAGQHDIEDRGPFATIQCAGRNLQEVWGDTLRDLAHHVRAHVLDHAACICIR